MTRDAATNVGSLVLRTRRADLVFAELPGILVREGIRVDEISSPDDNLESVFRYLVES